MAIRRRQLLRAAGTALPVVVTGCATAPMPAGSPTDEGRSSPSSPTATATPTASPRRTPERTATIPATAEIGFGSGAWRQFAHDERNTGANADTTGPDAPLGLAWESSILGEKPTFTSPAVVDGTVYFGNSNNRVYALDAVAGDERWSYETGRFVASSPAVTDDTVYVGSADAHVYALDRTDGSLRWSTPVDVTVDHGVTVADGVVYAGGRRGDDAGAIHAIDVDDGTVRWTTPTDGWMWTTPAVGHDAVVFADEGAFRALDVDDGRERWALDTHPTSETAPVVSDDAVYIATASPDGGIGLVSARDPTSGDAHWTVGLTAARPAATFTTARIPSAIAFDGDALYVVLNGESVVETLTPTGMPQISITGLLYKVDVTAREVVWATDVGVGDLEGPTVVDGTVYVGGYNGLTVVDAADGSVQWSRKLPGDIRRPPAVADDVVYVGTTGRLLALAEAV